MELMTNTIFRSTARTFITLMIGLIVYKLYVHPYNYWILITVILLLPSTTGATLQRAIARVGGTLIGVLIGLVLVMLLPESNIVYWGVILFNLFLVVYFARSYYGLAMFFGAIMIVLALGFFLAHGNLDQTWNFVLARFIDTFIAAIIVIATAYLIWPDRSKKKIQRVIVETEKQIYLVLLKMLKQQIRQHHVIDQQLMVIYQQLEDIQQLAIEAKQEPIGGFAQHRLIETVQLNFRMLFNDLVAIRNSYLLEENINRTDQQINHVILQFCNVLTELHDTSIKDTQRLMQAFYLLVNAINTNQDKKNSIFMDDKNSALAVLVISLRNICMNLQFINIAAQRIGRDTW